MREAVARWLGRRIGVARDGLLLPPTSDLGVRVQEPDGSEAVLISHGDSFDFVSGRGDEFSVTHLTPRAALRIAWFVVWRWWVRGTWCGLKASAWQWCVEVHLEEIEIKRRSARAQANQVRRKGP